MQATISPMFTSHPTIPIPEWVQFLARPSIRWISRPIVTALAAWKRARARRYYHSISSALHACRTYDEVVRILGQPVYGLTGGYEEIHPEGVNWLQHEADPLTRRKYRANWDQNISEEDFVREFGQGRSAFFREITKDLAARGLATAPDCVAYFLKKGCQFDVPIQDGRVLKVIASDAFTAWELLAR